MKDCIEKIIQIAPLLIASLSSFQSEMLRRQELAKLTAEHSQISARLASCADDKVKAHLAADLKSCNDAIVLKNYEAVRFHQSSFKQFVKNHASHSHKKAIIKFSTNLDKICNDELKLEFCTVILGRLIANSYAKGLLQGDIDELTKFLSQQPAISSLLQDSSASLYNANVAYLKFYPMCFNQHSFELQITHDTHALLHDINHKFNVLLENINKTSPPAKNRNKHPKPLLESIRENLLTLVAEIAQLPNENISQTPRELIKILQQHSTKLSEHFNLTPNKSRHKALFNKVYQALSDAEAQLRPRANQILLLRRLHRIEITPPNCTSSSSSSSTASTTQSGFQDHSVPKTTT